MNEMVKALQQTGVFAVATVENGEPKVRPFGAVAEFEGKLYLCTGNQKAVYRQIKAHPQVQICGWNADATWVRLEGTLVEDSRLEAKEAMLQAVSILQKMYRVDDGVFTVFYLDQAKAWHCTMTGEPVPFTA